MLSLTLNATRILMAFWCQGFTNSFHVLKTSKDNNEHYFNKFLMWSQIQVNCEINASIQVILT